MSLIHVKLIKLLESERFLEFTVQCSGALMAKGWQDAGKIIIDKEMRNYSFYPSQAWEKEKVLPPSIYALPEDQRELIRNERYKDFWGESWALFIHARVQTIINDLPDDHTQG